MDNPNNFDMGAPLLQGGENSQHQNDHYKIEDQKVQVFGNKVVEYDESPPKKAEGKLDLLLNQVNQRIQEKKEEKKKKTEAVPYSKILLSFADREDKLLLAGGYITAIVTGIGLPSFVFLFGNIVDSFGGNSIVDKIRPVSIQFTVIGVAIWVTTYLFFTMLTIVSERIGKKTRVAYLNAILTQDIEWFDTINATELPARLSKECQAIQKGLGEKFGQILMSFAMSCSGLFFAFFRGWWMSLILLFCFPAIFLGSIFISLAVQSGFIENLRAYGQSAGYAEQALNAIRVVQAFGQEQTESVNYDRYLGRARSTGIRVHIKGGFAIGFFFFVMFGYYGYAFYTGSFLITNQVYNSNQGKDYTAGDIMTCFFGIVFGVFSLGMATPNIKAVTEGRVAGKIAYEIIDRKPKILLDSQQYQRVGDLRGKIEFKNVTFRYQARKEQKVLDEFSATFEEGKTTAIVGASGSGKSTIIQLIERFYDPESGEILIDGRPLQQLNLRELRRKIGYVGQEPVLFNSSIKQNLLYGEPNATDEQVIAALKSANAWDFINEKMGEGGIHTNVGNAGGQLSGGQKQRIAIARAFIKKPKILLLDEATSALDKKNEKEVQASIDKIRQELGSITTVVIAHRLSTIRNADNIIVMQKGKIIEQGNHEYLLENYPEGLYAKFVKEQEQSEQQQQQNENDDGELHDPLEQVQQNNSILRRSTLNKRNSVVEKQEKAMKEKHDEIDKQKDEQLEQIKKQIAKGKHVKRMVEMGQPKINIFLGVFVSLVLGCIMPCFGIFIGQMLFVLQPSVINPMDVIRSDSNKWCLLMFVCSLLAFVTGVTQIISFGIVGENITLKLRKALYDSILVKNIGWFDSRDNTPGVLSSTMATDVQTVNGLITGGLGTSLQAIFSVLVGIIIGFICEWKVALVCLACVPFVVFGGIMNAKQQQGLSTDTEAASKDANLLAGDSIINYRTVASFGNENQILKDYSDLLEGPVSIAKRKTHLIGFVYGFSQFTQYGVNAVLYYGAALILQNYIDNETDPLKTLDYTKWIFSAIFSMFFGAMSAGQASQFGPDFGKAKAASNVVFGIIDVPSEMDVRKEETREGKRVDLKTFRGEIEFKNVWFRYPTRKNDWILKGLNLRIRPNETVALVGESGCGKSTTVQLLMRFYDVDEGQILLDGVDIRDYNLVDLRRAMGLVQQEPTLFNYTISENILYGHSNATNSEVYESARVANALEFIEGQEIDNTEDSAAVLLQQLAANEQMLIEKIGLQEYQETKQLLEDVNKDEIKKGRFVAQEGDIDRRDDELKDMTLHQGFNIQCGLKGSKLSGGQKQRIAIARAVIRRPQILILDEATSALDEASQRTVQVALDNIMKDRTSIVIAHRLSTVEKCDRILVLESGRLVEEGGFNELKNKDGGIFSQLASGFQGNNHKQS